MIRLFLNKKKGKGHAIKLGQQEIKEKYTIIQDADLEYDPKDYLRILRVLKKQKYKVVYGSRMLNTNHFARNNFTSNIRLFANHVLTITSNIINSQNLTDAHTCYKAFDSSVFKKLNLIENGFGFEPEVTAKIAKKNLRIYEVGVSYFGRKYKDGKKITWKDGFSAIRCIIKYNLF